MRHYSAAFSRPQWLRFLFIFLQCLYSCYYVLYGKSKVWEQLAVRSGCTEAIHSDDIHHQVQHNDPIQIQKVPLLQLSFLHSLEEPLPYIPQNAPRKDSYMA